MREYALPPQSVFFFFENNTIFSTESTGIHLLSPPLFSHQCHSEVSSQCGSVSGYWLKLNCYLTLHNFASTHIAPCTLSSQYNIIKSIFSFVQLVCVPLCLLPLLNPVTCALFPHLFPTGSHSTSVNWVIKYFYICAFTGRNSHINTVITEQTFCFEGQACHTDFCLPIKYFITSKWKIVHPIQTYLQVIHGGI